MKPRGSSPGVTPRLDPGAIGRAADGLVPPDAPPRIRIFPDEWPREDRVARKLWAMTAPMRAEYVLDGVRYQRTIWASEAEPFIYNGASVPRPAWSILAADKLHRPSGWHDEDYRCAGAHKPGAWEYWDGRTWRDVPRRMSRKEADRIFRALCRRDPEGPGAVGAAIAYRMLRLFGGGAWGPKAAPSLPEVTA